MNDMKPTQRGMLHRAMGIHPGEKLGIAELMRAKKGKKPMPKAPKDADCE